MSTPLPAVVQAPGQTRTSMDELMLAMDIVDTLRHEQSLVERELASTERDDAFVARVKQIYASQGIEVTDTLIRQGVESLKQDRFVYQPPQRTIAVRMAEFWIDRWRWAKRVTIVGFVVAFGYAVVAIPNAWVAAREYGNYTEAVSDLQQRGQRLAQQVDLLEIFVKGWQADAPARVAGHLGQLARDYGLRRVALGPAIAATQAVTVVDDGAFEAAPEASYATLSVARDGLEAAEREARELEARVKAGERLLSIARQFDHANTRLASMRVSDTVTGKLDETRARAEVALAAADDAVAATAVAAMTQFAATLDLSYTLRIVNREGVKSGVWRHHADAPDGKNYYVVVEAVDASGQVLALPVLNEETQKTLQVSLFALRVPQSEYDRVKADKLDNGLIDNALVGEKRRGELDAEYHIAVAGGTITDW